jgi:hypothetical protein
MKIKPSFKGIELYNFINGQFFTLVFLVAWYLKNTEYTEIFGIFFKY